MHPLPPEIVRAIVEEPFADDPRLIAADWLDDHGDADWARLIRLQIQQPTTLDVEQRLLIQQIKPRLIGMLGPLARWVRTFGIRRGFPCEISFGRVTSPNGLIELRPFAMIERLRFDETTTGLGPNCLTTLAEFRGLRMLFLPLEVRELTWEQVAPLGELIWLKSLEITGRDGDSLLRPHRADLVRARYHVVQHHSLADRVRWVKRRYPHRLNCTPTGLARMRAPRMRTSSRWACIFPELRALDLDQIHPRDRLSEYDLGAIESISIRWRVPTDRTDFPQMLNLREVVIASHISIVGDGLAGWIRTLPRLQTLAIPGSGYDFTAISTAIQGSKSLRMLHLPGSGPRLQSLLERWNTLNLPSLIELSAPTVESIDWAALRKFLPRLHGLHLVATTTPKEFPTLCEAGRAIGIYVSLELKKGRVSVEPNRVHRWLEANTRLEIIAPGIRLRLPDWLVSIPPARTIDMRDDVTPIAEWREFGFSPESPEMLLLGSVRIRIERFPHPPGPSDDATWLRQPPLPELGQARTLTIGDGALTSVGEHWHCLRVIWIRGDGVYRMRAESPVRRTTPWPTMLEWIAARVEIH